MFRFRKLILIVTLFIAIFFGYFGIKLPEVLEGDGFETDGSYATTNHLLEENFGQSTSPYIVMFYNDNNQSEQAFSDYIATSVAEIDQISEVSQIASPIENVAQMKPDIAYALVSFKEDTDASKNTANLEKAIVKSNDFHTSLTGGSILDDEFNDIAQSDLKTAEKIGLPIALIVLLLAFGGVVAGFIPLVSGAVSVLVSMGICYFLGKEFDLSIYVLNVTPMIGLAVSIDFALLFTQRFREELRQHPVSEAVRITSRTAGRAIVFSGSCVALGLVGMFFIDVDIFKSVATSGIVVVIVSVILANTFLPALLGLLGHRVNTLRIFKEKEKEEGKGIWHLFASFVMKRPVKMMLAALVVLVLAVIPMFHIKLEVPDITSLPESSPAKQTYQDFAEYFVSDDTSRVPIVMTLENGDAGSSESLEEVQSFAKELEKDPIVKEVNSVFSASQIDDPVMLEAALQDPVMAPLAKQFIHDDTQMIAVTLNEPATSKEAQNWAGDLQEGAENHDGFTYSVGGEPKFNQEIFDAIWAGAPYGIAFILVTTFLILLVAFRSVLIPLKAVLMNILSLSAAFGLIVWIFQDGHLGVDAAPIAVIIPVFMFSVVFGLSMDYEVFLISRIQEVYLETGDNDIATLMGLTSTSKIITSAAAIIIAVTGAFAFTEILPVKQVGIGVAIAIFIDATIVRMILVPSLMKLLGNWNWWFPFSGKKKSRKVGY